VWALTFNASIDGVPLGQHHFDGVFGCCNETIKPALNITLFDQQYLSFSAHVLTIQLMNSTSGFVFLGNGSEMRLDYIVINDTASALAPPFRVNSAKR
jgi:hypothetical protein